MVMPKKLLAMFAGKESKKEEKAEKKMPAKAHKAGEAKEMPKRGQRTATNKAKKK